jgi:hypothetical protein
VIIVRRVDAEDLLSRVAFVGQRAYIGTAVPPGAPFVEVRANDEDGGAVNAALRATSPRAIVAFRPNTLPPRALDGLDGTPVLGVATEPLTVPYNLAELARVDRSLLARLVVTDPGSFDPARAAGLPAWRAMPLPVGDDYYNRPRRSGRPPRIIFIGYSTMHREQMLIGLKHEFDLPHYAHALMGDDLREVLAEADVGLVVHPEDGLDVFEDTILLHLAAGHLVLAEPLEPRYGLVPGRDYVEVADRDELRLRVAQLHRAPEAYDRVRVQGHHASLPFAASRVWPRVIQDFLADVAVFA